MSPLLPSLKTNMVSSLSFVQNPTKNKKTIFNRNKSMEVKPSVFILLLKCKIIIDYFDLFVLVSKYNLPRVNYQRDSYRTIV